VRAAGASGARVTHDSERVRRPEDAVAPFAQGGRQVAPERADGDVHGPSVVREQARALVLQLPRRWRVAGLVPESTPGPASCWRGVRRICMIALFV
jgi:hypothetical protein